MLTTVQKAKTYLRERVDGYTASGVVIYHDMTGNVDAATVKVTSTHLILETNLARVTFRLEDPFFSTLTLLVAAINALPGWHASLQIDGSTPTSSIIPTASTSVLRAENSGVLNVGADWLLSVLINAVSLEIEHAINDTVLQGTYSDIYQGGSDEYTVRHIPVTEIIGAYGQQENAFSVYVSAAVARSSVEVTLTQLKLKTVINGITTSVTIDLANHTMASLSDAIAGQQYYSTSYETALAGLAAVDLIPAGPIAVTSTGVSLSCWSSAPAIDRIDYGSGVIYLLSPLPPKSKIKIVYKAGYVTVPADLELIALDLVGALWDRRPRDMSLESERMSGYSWDAKKLLMDTDVRRRLAPYICYTF